VIIVGIVVNDLLALGQLLRRDFVVEKNEMAFGADRHTPGGRNRAKRFQVKAHAELSAREI
jgi:hypothetical protein